MHRQLKIIVEKHSDGYVAYPLGLKGVVVSEGDSYEEVLISIKSAIEFHIETFGDEESEGFVSRHLGAGKQRGAFHHAFSGDMIIG
jgi:predicted RNase H-like HicB family nuclease